MPAVQLQLVAPLQVAKCTAHVSFVLTAASFVMSRHSLQGRQQADEMQAADCHTLAL